jgi:hypothetical protein
VKGTESITENTGFNTLCCLFDIFERKKICENLKNFRIISVQEGKFCSSDVIPGLQNIEVNRVKENFRFGSLQGLINYIDTKAKCSHLKKLT